MQHTLYKKKSEKLWVDIDKELCDSMQTVCPVIFVGNIMFVERNTEYIQYCHTSWSKNAFK